MKDKVIEIHTCGLIPKGYAVCRHPASKGVAGWHGGWMLTKKEYEIGEEPYEEEINPWKNDEMKYCPWCGERLD